jgi:hypothetical protein
MTYIPQTQVGRGTTLSWTPTGGSLTAFLSLVSVTPPAGAVGEVENLLLASLFGPYLPTIPEGEGSFKVQHWDGDVGCVAMQAACRVAPVPLGVFLITLPSGATISIPGFPKKYAVGEVQNKEIVMADVDYRQTAPMTYTPPA